MFIDSEGCMQCRRLFPAVRLQPTSDIFCAVLNAKVPGWDSSSNVIHSQPTAIFINKNNVLLLLLHVTIRTNKYEYYKFISVSLFQLEQAEESHQKLLKTKTDLEHDLEIKKNSLFIDSELCMGSRRWFPVKRMQPNCQLLNKAIDSKYDLNKGLDGKVAFQYLYWIPPFHSLTSKIFGWLSPRYLHSESID